MSDSQKAIAVMANSKNYAWFIQALPPGRLELLWEAGYLFVRVDCVENIRGNRIAAYTNVLGGELPTYSELVAHFSNNGISHYPHNKFMVLPTHMIVDFLNSQKI